MRPSTQKDAGVTGGDDRAAGALEGSDERGLELIFWAVTAPKRAALSAGLLVGRPVGVRTTICGVGSPCARHPIACATCGAQSPWLGNPARR